MLWQVLDWKLVEQDGTLLLRCALPLQAPAIGSAADSLLPPFSRVWLAKDAAAGEELAARITRLADGEGAPSRDSASLPPRPRVRSCVVAPSHHRRTGHSARAVVSGQQVTVELATAALKGLSENDFIVAAKADELSLADLVPVAKKRTYFF